MATVFLCMRSTGAVEGPAVQSIV